MSAYSSPGARAMPHPLRVGGVEHIAAAAAASSPDDSSNSSGDEFDSNASTPGAAFAKAAQYNNHTMPDWPAAKIRNRGRGKQIQQELTHGNLPDEPAAEATGCRGRLCAFMNSFVGVLAVASALSMAIT